VEGPVFSSRVAIGLRGNGTGPGLDFDDIDDDAWSTLWNSDEQEYPGQRDFAIMPN
jgi:hypothetical protein